MSITMGYATDVPRDDLIIWLDAGNSSSYSGSGTTWYDLSGYGHHCVWSSTPSYTSANGGYFTFDGANNYGTITKTATMDYWNDQQTLIMFLRHSFTTGRRNPWDQAYGGVGTWTHETGDTMSQYFGTSGSNGSPYVGRSSGTTPRSAWNMIAATRDQISHRWWINGNLSTLDTNPYGRCGTTAASPRVGNGYAGFWQGDMGAVLAYKRALSKEELNQIYSYYSNRFSLGNGSLVYRDGSSESTSPAPQGALISVATFTSTGTFVVPSNCNSIHVKLVGGGGGSAGYCESGGAGGYAEGIFPVNPGTSYAVTIGGGGGGVGYYAAAGDGGTTSFGSLLSATGGYGANRNYSHGGGHGGVGSGGFVALYGGSGTGHANSGSHSQTAAGGGSYFGGPGGQTRGATGTNFSPSPGSGASGGITEIANSGTAGPAGIVVVYAYR